jgi:carbon-monoxide dehydrogenase small subunit
MPDRADGEDNHVDCTLVCASPDDGMSAVTRDVGDPSDPLWSNRYACFKIFPRSCSLLPLKRLFMKKKIQVTVNGTAHQSEVESRMLLVHYLRDALNLTGTHIGCETSLCGACTVMVDGLAVKSCTVLAVQTDGAKVTTIEGLAQNGDLHPVQQGFWDKHGLQCGYCTPGMIVAAAQLLERNPDPTEEQIRHGLEGNLCRCTGYQHIVQAVQSAAKNMKSKPAVAR